MNREFLINIIFLISINLLIKPFYIFGIDRTVQNMVGSTEYGLYFALFNFTFLFYIINYFGMQNFNSRNIAQNNHLLDKYFPNIIALKVLLGGIYLGVVFILAHISGYTEEVYHILFFIAINQMLIALIFYLRSNIAALGMYRTDSIVSVLDKVFMIIICSILIWGISLKDDFKIEWFIYAQTVSLTIASLIAFVIVGKRLKRFKFQIDTSFFKVILKESYPYALVLFLMTIYARIDGVMIERLLVDGKDEAGIYASAYRLLDASNMIGFLFAGLLLPMFSKMLKEGESVNQLLKLSFQLIWSGAITLAIASFFFKTEIMELLYTEATSYSGEVLGFLMLSFVAVTAIYIFGTLLTANGNLKRMNIIFIIGIIMNVTLNYFLIQSHKALGAAVATLITQGFVMIAEMYLAKKEFNLNFDVHLAFRFILFAGLFCLISFSFYNYASIDWRVSFILNILVGLSLALFLKLLNYKLLLDLFSKKINN